MTEEMLYFLRRDSTFSSSAISPSINSTPAGTDSICPRERLSRTITLYPSSSSLLTVILPIYPAPPVTRMVFSIRSPPDPCRYGKKLLLEKGHKSRQMPIWEDDQNRISSRCGSSLKQKTVLLVRLILKENENERYYAHHPHALKGKTSRQETFALCM